MQYGTEMRAELGFPACAEVRTNVACFGAVTINNPNDATRSPIRRYLEELHARLSKLDTGRVATYIPELARANPAAFGVVIATVDGHVYEVGATRQQFTIQSISKPLIYGVALEDRGGERVRQAIGVEPSGDAFNSISLEPGTGRPLNPMINAGAIATSSLVAGATTEARIGRVVDAVSAYAGRPLELDEAVFESERATGHRNRAIGHMLRNYGIVSEDPEPALELYFKQCSILIDCRDLAMIGATLANGGVNPATGARAVRSEFVDQILSVMTTCGMYDFAGEWVYRVGMPAKSGVGGGIVAVLPGQLGIGVFSPALDERGNSVRGVAVCEALSNDLGLHFLHPPRPSVSTVRSRYTLATVRSKRRRPANEVRLLDEHGARVAIYELQGDLRFTTVERVVREIIDSGAALDFAVLDFKRVAHVDGPATRMLAALTQCCAAEGRHLVFTRVRRGDLLASFGAELDPRAADAVSFQPQLDLGLEWCERRLLERYAMRRSEAGLGGLLEHRLCAGVTPADVAHLERIVERREFEPGALIVHRGDPADALYFLVKGDVSVVVELPKGGYKRLSTLTPGMGFGESALIAGGVRSADVRADSAVECYALTATAFGKLERDRPRLMIGLLMNLLRSGNEMSARLTSEVAALEG
ncbi:MAG TPA: glutaminase A [Pseudomonadales bacterium]|nr:glutaminase A [Pseudomonadales bacterium]